MAKFAVTWGFGHIYWRNPQQKTSSFCENSLTFDDSFRKGVPRCSVFFCDSHRDYTWTRSTSKADHGVAMYAEKIKFRVKWIPHASNKEEIQSTLTEF